MPRKKPMSFEQRRKALYKHMVRTGTSEVLSQEIKFSDHGVAKFLQDLDKVERDSLKSKLIFR
jgi:hypothetical protein